MTKEKRISVSFDRKDGHFKGLDDSVLNNLQEIYPNVKISKEIKKMELWLSSSKGVSRVGSIGFIMNWLQKCAPEKLGTSSTFELIESDSPLGNLLKSYWNELWKDREHILEFNTIRK